MSQITSLGQYNFYQQYLWGPADFAQFQTWLQNLTYATNQGAFGAAVLSGLNPTAGAGLSVNTTAGIAVGDEGQVMSAVVQNTPIAPPAALPRWDLLVIRPTVTEQDEIPEPTDPNVNVPLQELLGYTILLILGTEASNPVYPAKQDGDCIICGVQTMYGQTQTLQSNLDQSQRELPNKTVHAIRTLNNANTPSGVYSVSLYDETIDADASSAASGLIAVLPPALQAFGQDFLVTKIDSSANDVSVSGTDPINGESVIVLEAQWQSVTVRSVGTGWRML